MPSQLPFRQALPLWALFAVLCFGLGYPTLNRYDPGKVPGTSDAAGFAGQVRAPIRVEYRAFVPWVARPFYLLANGHSGSWDPALLGLLVANSLLMSGAAVGILAIGLRLGFAWPTCLIAVLLFLVDWVVPNLHLSGYVDSGELLCLVLLTWSLLSNRWYLLPLWSIPGSLSKETFAPFAFILALTWWAQERPLNWRRAVRIALAAALSCGTVVVATSTQGIGGALAFTGGMGVYQRVGFLHALLRNFAAREFWYTFVWLLPLGLVHIRRIDRRWSWAVAATSAAAALMGAYNDALGNTTRAFFNIAGPMLCLSAASFLAGLQPAGPNMPAETSEN